MDTFAKIYDENIRPLMDKIDQVRPLLSPSNDGIIFPNVVVVGDQSSGKSTLLEALSLVELPKGNGIVTRCPLVLRLRRADKRNVYRLYDDNRKVLLDEENLNMPEYIEQATRELAGNHKNIVEDLIELEVEDPHVRDLTVVDLPGIARYALKDQPQNIQEQTKNLINKYIRQKGCVILCVFPANLDIAVVESISLARDVDPSGERTIGVITKSDLAVNQNMLVQQLLMNRDGVTHLKLGFIAVRNRSTDENISLDDAREREKEFFRQHPAAATVDKNCLGVDALINRLATLYSQRVKETFPKLREAIQGRLTKITEELNMLPPNLKTSAERVAKYNELVDLYVEKILKVELMGSNNSPRQCMVNILHQKFTAYREILREQRKELSSAEHRSKVQQELSKHAGAELPNFLSSSVLKQFICEKLNQLWDITEKLINECFRATISQLSKAESNACNDHILPSKITKVFHHVSMAYINEMRNKVHDQLRALLELDQNDPYTINTYYMDLLEKYKGSLGQNNTAKTITVPPTIKILGHDDDDLLIFNIVSIDDQALKQMLISMYSYWYMLTKRFIDYVTLCLRARCIFDLCPNIQQRLRQISVQRCDLIDTCLAEDPFIRNKRKELLEQKKRFEAAYYILHADHEADNNDDSIFTDFTPITNDLSPNLDAVLVELQRAANGFVFSSEINPSTINAGTSKDQNGQRQPTINIGTPSFTFSNFKT
jgi:interferon-induced GTP-binding protein Mx1